MAHTNQIYRDHIERRFKVEVWSGFVVSASSDPFVTSRRASSSSSSHRIVKYCVIRVCDSPNPPSLFLFCFVFFFHLEVLYFLFQLFSSSVVLFVRGPAAVTENLISYRNRSSSSSRSVRECRKGVTG